MPLPWLATVSKLPGRSLHVGVVVWYLAGLTRSRKNLRISNELVANFGIDSYSKSRALRELKNAKLVTVEQKGKASPLVSLITQQLREST